MARQPLKTIGLEIDNSELKLFWQGKKLSLPVDSEAIENGLIVKPKMVARVICDFFKKEGINSKNVNLSVGQNNVLLRLMQVPDLGKQGINDFIKTEASKYIIFAGNQLISDFHALGELRDGQAKKINILAAITKKEVIDSYIQTLKLAGLNLLTIEPHFLAILRAAFEKKQLSQESLILTAVADDRASIFVFQKGKLFYLHNVDSLSSLDQEIESVLGYCKSKLGQGFEPKIIRSNNLEDIYIPRGLCLRGDKDDQLLIDVNLLPEHELEIRCLESQIVKFLCVLGILVLSFIICFGVLRFKEFSLFRKIEAMQDSVKNPPPMLNQLLDIEQSLTKYRSEMKYQESILSEVNDYDWNNILTEIKRIIPKKVFLTKISSREDGEVLLAGEAADPNSVFDFVKSLRSSVYFENIKLEETEDKEVESESQDEMSSFNTYFVIKCRLVK